jgi:hypothetical protein
VEQQFESRILKSFDIVTQELYRYLSAMIHTQVDTKIKTLIELNDGSRQQLLKLEQQPEAITRR